MGYSQPRVRCCLRRRRIEAAIPAREGQRKDPDLDEEAYRRRDVGQRCVSWLKEGRRPAIRLGKLAVHSLATA